MRKRNKTRRAEQVKVGDVVDYHSIIDGPTTSRGHVVEVVQGDMVWISGKSGCVDVDALTIQTPDENWRDTSNACDPQCGGG